MYKKRIIYTKLLFVVFIKAYGFHIITIILQGCTGGEPGILFDLRLNIYCTNWIIIFDSRLGEMFLYSAQQGRFSCKVRDDLACQLAHAESEGFVN